MSDPSNLLRQNQQLTEEVKRRVDQIAAIGAVATSVSQSLDLSETLTTALEAVVNVVGAEAAGLSLIDKLTDEVVLRAQLGWINDFVERTPMRIPAGKGMSGQVIANDQVIVHNDLDGTEKYAVPSFKKEHFRSIAMAPMHARGKIIGILSIMSHQADRFDSNTISVLSAVADTVGVAVDNARLYEGSVEQETRLSAVFHSTADGIIATDRNSRISLVNAAAENLLEIRARHLIGVPLREAPIQTRVRDQLLFALSSPDEKNKSFQVALESGRIAAFIVSPVRVKSQVEYDVEMDGWVIVLQDVTHLREAEIARAQFIQAAAHDMRNPLSVTNSSINLLASILEDKDDETINEVIELARGGISRLQRLIEDLLQIEKIESGYGFELEPADIHDLCREVSAEVTALMQSKSLKYSCAVDKEIPRDVPMDRNWISRALHNYLENAYKYTQENGKIELKVFLKDSMVHFEVVDNGPGIPAAAQTHLFERFYRVKETKDIRGSGLGLAIVKSVIETHGGSVYVRSKVGDGSTFGFTLPRTQKLI